MTPKNISSYILTVAGSWETHTFSPLFDATFVWCSDVLHSFCQTCSLGCYCHPLVRDPENENMFHKLCTLSVAKVGLIDLKHLTSCKGGCNPKDSDYSYAVKMLKNLKFVPTKQRKTA